MVSTVSEFDMIKVELFKGLQNKAFI